MRALIPNVIDDVTDERLAEIYRWPSPTDSAGEQLPWLRANFAATVDGAVTGSDGLSASVSSADDKRVFALLRATCDAVVVGAGTARAEGYGPVIVRASMASVRDNAGLTAPPRLVVITRSAAIDPASAMFSREAGGRFSDEAGAVRPPTIVITCAQAPATNIARIASVADVVICGDSAVDLDAAVSHLASLGLRRLLCEGGPSLFGDLLSANLVDDLCLTTSPLLSGSTLLSGSNTAHRSLIGTGGDLTSGGSGAQGAPTRTTLASLVQADDSLLARWLITKDVGFTKNVR